MTFTVELCQKQYIQFVLFVYTWYISSEVSNDDSKEQDRK